MQSMNISLTDRALQQRRRIRSGVDPKRRKAQSRRALGSQAFRGAVERRVQDDVGRVDSHLQRSDGASHSSKKSRLMLTVAVNAGQAVADRFLINAEASFNDLATQPESACI
jgi:hypothetical protein